MHWGDVNSSTITDYQNNITGFLVNNDVDMILGSHPSVVEPMKIIQNAEGKNILVAYSLGNYISSLKYENADVELILNIQISLIILRQFKKKQYYKRLITHQSMY